MKPQESKTKTEFGDFQTPDPLARACCVLLKELGCKPASIVEPTCGQGNFLVAALETLAEATEIIGVEIAARHLELARNRINRFIENRNITLLQQDYFLTDWQTLLDSLPEPLLIIGNPPWVTNSELGCLGSRNLPHKSNFKNQRGIDALMGKSNFDISEWMLLDQLKSLNSRHATLAVLCKTTVARKVLAYAWSRQLQINQAELHRIDTRRYFEAAVDACFLIVHLSKNSYSNECTDYRDLHQVTPSGKFGLRENCLVADIDAYERWRHLRGGRHFKWRSGIKHDCAKICELEKVGDVFENGLGEQVDLELDYLFPMLKSSELASAREIKSVRWMVVTQRSVGEDTKAIQLKAPKLWHYLLGHRQWLDRRASSIYRGRPRFAMFGVGDYAFSSWKVAISGLYKHLSFRVVGPVADKPVVLDDTCYFLPCTDRSTALAIADLLNSEVAKEFFSAFIFWDAKRPVTLEILHELDLIALAHQCGVSPTTLRALEQVRNPTGNTAQGVLFAKTEL